MATILFPTDFSETANNAFLYALNLAKAKESDIRVVTLKTHLKSYLDMQDDEFENQINQLKNIAKENGFEQIKITSSLEIGDLLLTILNIVKKEKISYIVMGTNGENSFGKKFFGSQTLSVINNSPIPVLAVPHDVKYQENQKFAYATLFNSKENSSFEKMVNFSKDYKASLTLIHVNKGDLSSDSVMLKKDWEFAHPDVNVEMIDNQDVETGILNYCESNSIAILGLVYRDLNPFKRLFTESYSRQLLTSAKFAILVLKGE